MGQRQCWWLKPVRNPILEDQWSSGRRCHVSKLHCGVINAVEMSTRLVDRWDKMSGICFQMLQGTKQKNQVREKWVRFEKCRYLLKVGKGCVGSSFHSTFGYVWIFSWLKKWKIQGRKELQWWLVIVGCEWRSSSEIGFSAGVTPELFPYV